MSIKPMIAIEELRPFQGKDVAIIAVSSIAWLAASLALTAVSSLQAAFLVSVGILSCLMALTVHMARKAGAATAFMLAAGLLTFSMDHLGIVGWNKVLAFIVAGALFELVFLMFKLGVSHLEFDIAVGAAFAAAAVPILGLLLTSPVTVVAFAGKVFNLAVSAFMVGLVGSVFAALVWFRLRTTKFFLEVVYS